MEQWYRICACAVIAVILAVTVRSTRAELALPVTLGACVLLGIAAASALRPVLAELDGLRTLSGFSASVLQSVWKVCAISVLSSVVSAFCGEAGQAAVAKLVELCAGALALCAAMPLLHTVLEYIQELLG